ncbi:NAD-dependent epimerase/dehydratase family protein [Nocardiopsis aegyptia]|uniref:NAD-dependent epimerase/dehydratase family protein n=1 Tax=Nocardiopsis aegyptia TaxID=220378 RepID=UPI00367003DF
MTSVPHRRYLITGATGFVGRRLVRHMLGQGREVTALVRCERRGRDLGDAGARLVRGDLATGRGLAEAVRGADAVVHLAAAVAAPDAATFRRVNAEGTRRLAEAAARQATPPRFVLCSSLAAAGPHTARPRSERVPVSHYGHSKRAGEAAVRALEHLPSAVVRPPIVYGPGDPSFLPTLLPLVRLGVAPRPSGPDRRYSLLHVDDLCTVLTAVADHGRTTVPGDPESGLYEPSDGGEHTWDGFTAALAAAVGRRPPVAVPVPLLAAAVAAHASEFTGRLRGVPSPFNPDKLRELPHSWLSTPTPALRSLGLAPPRPLKEGLHDTLSDL